MQRSDAKTGKEKHAVFKSAFGVIKSYRSQKNYLAAYVVTFSVIEDRLRALYVVWYQLKNQTNPTPKQIAGPFSNLVKKLQTQEIIPEHLAISLIEEAHRRNQLLHAAMWNLDVFNDNFVCVALNIARQIDRLTRNPIKLT